jgi:hypothetical protein
MIVKLINDIKKLWKDLRINTDSTISISKIWFETYAKLLEIFKICKGG